VDDSLRGAAIHACAGCDLGQREGAVGMVECGQNLHRAGNRIRKQRICALFIA
jgi:hypothetical protein